jgi:ABC-type Fe3+/spermidine/putrescine transport system ATPase subunit
MIKVQNLKRQFDRRGIAGLNDLSLSLDQGQVLAIMGPNGSGKTTLLKILAGEIVQDSGTFSTEGTVHLFSTKDHSENINVQKYLVQSVALDIEEDKKIQLARDLADTFEFTFQLRQNLNELSSGQKQKILLAKELINRPALLLMDEPFTHLDPFTRKDILKGLFTFIRSQNITVLWVTHDLEEAFEFSDTIGLMNFGKFEQFDSPEKMVQFPRNLFVSKFMGYRNFFPVSKNDNGWTTPWGNVELVGPESQDGILIIPDFAWKVCKEGLSFEISARHAGRQSVEYTLVTEARTAVLKRGPRQEVFPLNKKLKLTPLWEECFIISL